MTEQDKTLIVQAGVKVATNALDAAFKQAELQTHITAIVQLEGNYYSIIFTKVGNELKAIQAF